MVDRDDMPVRKWAKVTLVDGRVLAAGIDNRDFRAYDLTYRKEGWPPGTEAPFLLQNFVYAHALWRQGDITDVSPARLSEQIALIDEEDGEEEVRPTDAVPGDDS